MNSSNTRPRLCSHWIRNSPCTVKYVFLIASWSFLIWPFQDPEWNKWGFLIICISHDVDNRSMCHWKIRILEFGSLSTVLGVFEPRKSMSDDDGSAPRVDGKGSSGLSLPFILGFLAGSGLCKTFIGALRCIFDGFISKSK